jgi:hypothetical protein
VSNFGFEVLPYYVLLQYSLAKLEPMNNLGGCLTLLLTPSDLQVTGSSSPSLLTPSLLKQMFTAYGENELAADEALLDEMVKVAESENGMLDTDTFATALTYDIRLYDVHNEVRLATSIDDIFLEHQIEGVSGRKDVTLTEMEKQIEGVSGRKDVTLTEMEENERGSLVLTEALVTKYTAPAIDITAGTYRSKGLMVFLWATVLISYFA